MANLYDYEPCPPDRTPDRTIVIMGKTGNGKSTLANVIAGRYDGDLFPESSSSTSETVGLPTHTVLHTYAGKEYAIRIIDTMGFGDNRFTEEQVLAEIADLAHMCSDGINQLLFVTSGRFTEEERQAADTIIDVIFQPDVARTSTVVRTRTPARELAQGVVACKTAEYKQNLIRLHPSLARINTYLMVSNPDDGDQASVDQRRKTRTLLLNHIILHYRTVYTPPLFAEVKARVEGNIKQKHAAEEEIQKLRADLKADKIPRKDYEKKHEEQLEELRRANQNLADKMKVDIPWYQRLARFLGRVFGF